MMNSLSIPWVLIALIISTSYGLVPNESEKRGKERWTVETVLKQEYLRQIDISPDGRRILWVKRYPDFKKDKYLTDIFLTIILDSSQRQKPETIRLTRTGNTNNPKWSPDGKWIGFSSTRSGKEKKKNVQQIWLMDTRGGEPYPLTELENGIRSFAWLDTTTIVFSAREDKTYYEKELERAKDDAIVVEDTTLFWPIRLFTVDIKSKKITRLTRNKLQIGEFSPSPDGRYIVYSLNRSPITADARRQPKQYLFDRQTRKTVEIFRGQYFDPGWFQWTPDGKGFYAIDEFSSDPENEGAGILELYYFDLSQMQHKKVPLHWEWGIGFGGYAVTKNGVHVQLANGARMKPRFYQKTTWGWSHQDVEDKMLEHSTSIRIGPDGTTIVYDYSRPDTLPQFRYGKYRNGKIAQTATLMELNKYLRKLPIPRAEVIEWSGSDGETVNGILYYPLNYKPGRRYPLMVIIHGGPNGADLDAWRLSWTVYPAIWAQKEAFVLRPNYHGSGNHGLKFVESIKGRYYELEVPDIVKGVRYLIQKGWVDSDSLGVMGWSNGAILTIALTVQYPRMFQAAASGAGDVNWISDYGNCSFGVSFDDSYFGGPPWERLDHYIRKSPLFRMSRVTTPTIIFFGTEDRAVPTEQGWQHYRALQQIGKTPVRFILFPGQPHSLQRLSHMKRKMQEEIAWFDTYLFGKKSFQDMVEARALPDTAPLNLLKRRKVIRKINGLYGEMVNNILIPEIISLGDTLLIGRFEVTRAQFERFQPDYRFAAGTENYPANNISFEEAQAYVAWLSEKTGQTYRLPTEAELRALKKLAGASENTMAYWAGYRPTPEELQVIRKHMAEFTPDDLLMPVGSRPAGNIHDRGASLIFDVGGNVAEWAVCPSGEGKAMNGAAISLEDARETEPRSIPQTYIGIRVVRVK